MSATLMSAAASGRRYLSLALPRLSTDLAERGMSPEARACPRAVVAMEKGALRLAAVNGPAAALGLEPGLALADARARHPDLSVSDQAPEDAARMLDRLADACERYTPLIALDGADGLVLDVTGCAHLFGGEEGLVRDLLRRVAMAGFMGRAALAATRRAAFALARFAAGRGGAVVPAGEDLAVLLAPLPLHALGLGRPEVEALARLGFRRVGDLYGKPRAPLAARFGMELLRRLDEALGHAPAAMEYRFPAPVFCAERNLPEPVERVEDVLGLAAHLAATLAGAMERHGMGARRLDLVLFRVDGKVTRLAIGTSRPLRDPELVRRLFAEKVAAVSSLDPGFGFELVRLSVREACPLAAHQDGFGAMDDGAEALDGLVDRLSTRFGPARVRRLVPEDRHVPEKAVRDVPAQNAGGWANAAVALEALALEVPGASGMGMVGNLAGDEGAGLKAGAGARLSGLSRDLSHSAPRPLPGNAGAGPRDGRAVLDRGSAEAPVAPVSFSPAACPSPQPSPASGRGGAVATAEQVGMGMRAWISPPLEALSRLQGRVGRGAAPETGEAPSAEGNGDGISPAAEGARKLGMEPSGTISRLGGRGLAPDAGDGKGRMPAAGRSLGPGVEPDEPLPSERCRLPLAVEWAPSRGEDRVRDGARQSPPPQAGEGAETSGLCTGDHPLRDANPLPLAGEGREGVLAGARRKPGDILARTGPGRAVPHGQADDEPDLSGPSRPLRLLDKPEPVEAVAEVPDGPPIRFRWRRVNHVVARAEGPERIAAEWWRSSAEPPTRDYFRVETASGHRFWLFRAGLYGEGGQPAWFIHGLFG